MSDTVGDQKVVMIEYTLKAPDGSVLDASGDGPPLAYLHGAENIVPGLEKALSGKTVGDALDVTVPPAEGYGEREGEPFKIPRDQFPEGIQPGMEFVIEDPSGGIRPHWILAMDEQAVLVDANHPLAGMELAFSVKVVGVRDASKEEIEHGHPHGPGGHHHH